MEDKIACPNCKSDNTCRIVYGYPSDEEEFSRLVDEKKIVPGGCVISDNSPAWHCHDCQYSWGRYHDENDIDSFDYDQGFKINEVFDQ